MPVGMIAQETVPPTEFSCVCKEVHPRASDVCRGCRAAQMGRNCWEMAVSPCCDLSRDHCETCPVYASAMRELARTEKVRITLEGGVVIEGEVYKRRDQRMSDTFNDPSRTHIAITNAVIKHPPGVGLAPERRPVLLVAKRACYLICPIREQAA